MTTTELIYIFFAIEGQICLDYSEGKTSFMQLKKLIEIIVCVATRMFGLHLDLKCS